jgi:hypothetical protein
VEQVELEEVEAVGNDRVYSLGSFLKLLDDDIVASDALEAGSDRLVAGEAWGWVWWFLLVLWSHCSDTKR